MLVGLAVLALMALISPAVLATTPEDHADGNAPSTSPHAPVQLEGLGDGASIAFAINDHDVAVGRATGRHGVVRPVRWEAEGQVHRLRLLRSARGGSALAVNNRGEIVGVTHRSRGGHEGPDQATFWDTDGSAHLLRGLHGSRGDSTAYAVNEHGTTVGAATDRDGNTHAVIWEGRHHRLRDLGVGAGSVAYDINDAGDIAGVVNGVGFVIRDGEVIHLSQATSAARTINSRGVPAGALEWTFSRPNQSATWWAPDGDRFHANDLQSPDGPSFVEDGNDTGDRGDLVGSAIRTSDATGSALYWPDSGGLITLDPLSYHDGAFAHGINDQGLIVGASAQDHDMRATIWRP